MVQRAKNKMKVDLLLIFIYRSLKLFFAFASHWNESPVREGKHYFCFPLYLLLPCTAIGIYLWNDEVTIQPHLQAQNYSFPKFTFISTKMRYMKIV